MISRITNLIWLILSIIFIVAPLSYAQGHWKAVGFATLVAFLNSFGPRRNFIQGIAAGLLAGSTSTAIFSPPESLLFGVGVAFATGFGTTIAQESEIDRSRFLGAALIGLFLGITIGLVPVITKGVSEGLLFLIEISLISAVGVPLSAYIGIWLRPKLLLFSELWVYLREMGSYLVCFAFGYIVLAFLFACRFWSLWKVFPNSFKGVSGEPSIGEFFYFSLVTIATIGYGDITPVSGTARGLVGAEVVLGIGWVTIIFAAVLSHLQPRFAEIAERQREEAEKLKYKTNRDLSPIFTVLVSETEDDHKGVYATIRVDYGKDTEGQKALKSEDDAPEIMQSKIQRFFSHVWSGLRGLFGNPESMAKHDQREYSYLLWGPGIERKSYKKSGYKTAADAIQAATEKYLELKK